MSKLHEFGRSDLLMGSSATSRHQSLGSSLWPSPWATFMEVLDTSIANVFPAAHRRQPFRRNRREPWVLDVLPGLKRHRTSLSGWISSIIGRKRFYMSCVAIFTISSLLCGLAPNLGMLIFFRILQGAGGGGLQPSGAGDSG